MLTIRMVKGFGKALGEYLRQADYYAQGMKVEGYCQGQLCAAVGLPQNAAITDAAFERVAANRQGRGQSRGRSKPNPRWCSRYNSGSHHGNGHTMVISS